MRKSHCVNSRCNRPFARVDLMYLGCSMLTSKPYWPTSHTFASTDSNKQENKLQEVCRVPSE